MCLHVCWRFIIMLKRISFDNLCVHKIVRVCMRGVIAWSLVNATNLGLKGGCVCAFTSNLHFYSWQMLSNQSDLQERARIVQVSLDEWKVCDCACTHTSHSCQPPCNQASQWLSEIALATLSLVWLEMVWSEMYYVPTAEERVVPSLTPAVPVAQSVHVCACVCVCERERERRK